MSNRLPEWATDRRRPFPANLLEDAFRSLLFYAERENSAREGLLETPHRAARAWAELTSGYGNEPDLKTFPAEGYEGIMVVKDLPFYSLCEHHLLPFQGTADFAYIPSERILGLSKFARLLRHYSRRLQTQENLTNELVKKLWGHLNPEGVMVILRATHLCMAMRGAQSAGHTTITSAVKGTFEENAKARAEAMELLS